MFGMVALAEDGHNQHSDAIFQESLLIRSEYIASVEEYLGQVLQIGSEHIGAIGDGRAVLHQHQQTFVDQSAEVLG